MKNIYFVDFMIIILLTFMNIFGYIYMGTSGNPDMNFGILLYSSFFLLIYIFIKSIIGIVTFIKYYKSGEIKFEFKKMLLIVPYILLYCFFTIKFIYESNAEHYFDFFFLPRMIILPIAFFGNLLWFYYWIYMNKKNNISKYFLNIYNGIFMISIIIFIDPSILFILRI